MQNALESRHTFAHALYYLPRLPSHPATLQLNPSPTAWHPIIRCHDRYLQVVHTTYPRSNGDSLCTAYARPADLGHSQRHATREGRNPDDLTARPQRQRRGLVPTYAAENDNMAVHDSAADLSTRLSRTR